MSTSNITVRVDESTKKEFDAFCNNVGINPTSAVNMFIKNVLRTRTLPFIVTDTEEQHNNTAMLLMQNAIKSLREQSMVNGNENMSMDEVDAEIAAYRHERRNRND